MKIKRISPILILVVITIMGCVSPPEIYVPDEIEKIEIDTNKIGDCPTIIGVCEPKYSIIIDKEIISIIIEFLNKRKGNWGYASSTYPTPQYIANVYPRNRESFPIFIGDNWIGIRMDDQEVLQKVDESDLVSFKSLLKIE